MTSETGALCPQSLREAGQPDEGDEDSRQGRPGENAHEHADGDDRNGRHGDPPKRRVSHSVRAYTALLLLLRFEPEMRLVAIEPTAMTCCRAPRSSGTRSTSSRA